jgi:hypothetical protein
LAKFSISVDSTNEVLSVPGGQYTCYKYYSPELILPGGEIAPVATFLSSVGPIKIIDYTSDGSKPSDECVLVSTNFH